MDEVWVLHKGGDFDGEVEFVGAFSSPEKARKALGWPVVVIAPTGDERDVQAGFEGGRWSFFGQLIRLDVDGRSTG